MSDNTWSFRISRTPLGFFAGPIRKFLGIPDDLKMLLGISFGYPDAVAPGHRVRMGRVPVSESRAFQASPFSADHRALPQERWMCGISIALGAYSHAPKIQPAIESSIAEAKHMRTGIIGRGNIGGTIARKLAATDQTVKLAGRVGPEENRDQVEKIGALPVASSEAVKDVDAMR
jgi:hypothetical protein